MQKLITPLVVIVSFLSCSVGEKLTNDYAIEDVQTNSTRRNYKQLLIVAAGSNSFRVFSDNLYDQVAIELEKKSIKSKYFFLGHTEREIQGNLNDVFSTENFDALMVLNPTNTGEVSRTTDMFYGIPSQSTKLEQNLSIKLYDRNDLNTPVWISAVQTSTNFTKTYVYKNLTRLLLLQLQKNNIIR